MSQVDLYEDVKRVQAATHLLLKKISQWEDEVGNLEVLVQDFRKESQKWEREVRIINWVMGSLLVLSLTALICT